MAEHKGFQDLVADAKKKITEISPTDAAAKAKSSSDTVIVDVRDKDEFDESHIPDALQMSRGTIEFEVEDKFPDRNTKDGLQKRPLHGRRFQSLENSGFTDDEVIE
ncbi:MAG: hypothetical protein DMF29_10875 [Verrucomicrobia bacterium]|nr:MAG: hypothetical protein DMF29_10875 [Verrucomicrobiota bacterium]